MMTIILRYTLTYYYHFYHSFHQQTNFTNEFNNYDYSTK